MNKRQRRNRRNRRERNKSAERPLPTERVRAELYHGGLVCLVGKPFRYKAGRGIAKVGDQRSEHGPIKILVWNGIVVEGVRSASCLPESRVLQPRNEIAA